MEKKKSLIISIIFLNLFLVFTLANLILINNTENSQFLKTGDFYYKTLSTTGNESLYDVTFNDYNQTNTLICLVADFEQKELNVSTELSSVLTNYSVPETISFYKTNELSKQPDIERELIKANELSLTPNDFEEGDEYRFCYQANKEEDFYLKFGDNSVVIILEAEVVSQSLLSDVIAETGDANFTHLNISDTAPYDNLIAYWNFDGDVEDTLTTTHYDFTENGNDGTGVNQANASSTNCLGEFGECLGLDGDDDYVEISNPGNVFDGGNITISAWINPVASGTTFPRIVDRDYNDGFSFYWTESDDFIGGSLNDGNFEGGEDESEVCPAGTIIRGEWQHVVMTFDCDAIYIYHNGTLCGTNNAYDGCLGASTDNIRFGQRADAGDRSFEGNMDEIMIFDEYLTAPQISDIYNNQSARFKGTGTQELNNQSYLNLSGDYINVTTIFDNNFESNVSLFIQYYDSGWTSTSAQNITSGENATFDIGSSFTNITLNYTLIAGPNQTSTFYSPIIYDDIIISNYTIGVAVTTNTIDILFTNLTNYTNYKIVFQEGEEFKIFGNWSDEDSVAINDTNGACDFEMDNVVFENVSLITDFTLCDSGQGCDQDNPLEDEFYLDADNTTEDVTKDFVRMEICHEQGIIKDLEVTFECNSVTDSVTIPKNSFGLCANGYFEVIAESFSCMNTTIINVSLDNNANTYAKRHNITLWEVDREFKNHNETYDEGKVIFNSTYGLWEVKNAHERYTHGGDTRVTMNCSHSVDSNYNNETSKNITIVNKAPIISAGNVFLPSGTKYDINETDLETQTLIEYEIDEWRWALIINDDDLDTHNLTWYNSSGYALLSNQSVEINGDYNTTTELFKNFTEGNVYNLTIWANDTNNNRTITSFYYNVTNYPPSITINSPLNQTYQNTSMNWTITTTDLTIVDVCWMSVNAGVSNISMFNDSANVWNYSAPAPYSTGGYRSLFWCNDTLGLVNNTEFVDFHAYVSFLNEIDFNLFLYVFLEKVGILSRTFVQAVTLNLVHLKNSVLSRGFVQAITLSLSFGKNIVNSINIALTLTITTILNKISFFDRSFLQQITLNLVHLKNSVLSRGFVQAIILSISKVGGNIYERSFIQALTLNLVHLKNSVLSRTLIQTISLNFIVLTNVVLSRIITFAVTLSVIFGRFVPFSRSFLQAITLNLVHLENLVLSRTLIQAISLNFIVNIGQVLSRSFLQAITLTINQAESFVSGTITIAPAEIFNGKMFIKSVKQFTLLHYGLGFFALMTMFMVYNDVKKKKFNKLSKKVSKNINFHKRRRK